MILRFSQELCNTVFQNRFERMDENGNVEMIRLVSGTNEVVESKQDKNAKPKDFRTGYANIQEGDQVFYQTEITDKAILNYLKKTPYWGQYITEYDPIAKSKEESEGYKKEISVLAKISTMEEGEMLQLGYAVLGKEALEYAKANDMEGLRVSMFKHASEDSDSVSELMDNKNKKDFLLMALAFSKGIVEEGDAGNSVVWGDQNRSKICSVAVGEKPIDALMTFIETKEGQEVKQMIGLKIEEAAKEAKPKTTKKVEKVSTTPTEK